MRLSFALVLFLLLTLVPASAQDDSTTTLNLATPEDILTLDPGRLTPFDYAARDVVENLFVGLTQLDPETNRLVPGLAESWEMSIDGLTWTFHLRDDVNWVRHNPRKGETDILRPVVADDFVYAIRRACSPLTGAPYFTSIFIIEGCQVVYRADRRLLTDDFVARRIGVRAVDAHTVEYTLLFPAAYFLTFTAMPEFRALPQEYVDVPTAWAEQGSIVTNGPFVLAGWVHSHRMTLLRNPYWPGSFVGNIEQVTITVEPDAQESLRAFNAGGIDRLYVSAADATSLAVRPSVVMLGFSMERAPVDARGVRQALAWSIDRAALVNTALSGAGVAVTQLTPPGMVGEEADNLGRGYDPEAARQAFAAAGHANCGAVPEQIVIMIDDAPESQAIAEFIVAGWQRELGCNPGLFDIQPVNREARVVLANARDTYSDDFDYRRPHVWLVSWSADYFDANNWFFDALHCRYGMFRTDTECDETDALIEAAGVQYDADARVGMYAEIEDRWFGVAGKYPIVPLYAAAQPLAQHAWLSGVNTAGPARFDRWVIDVGARESS